jgi:RNA polymerase sigma factor (TIGR02999 family)
MRRLLVDRARGKLANKRDGGVRCDLPELAVLLTDPELIALDEVLLRLAIAKPDHARLVELRFFGGLTGDEAAEALRISPATADRMWHFARAWLQIELTAR